MMQYCIGTIVALRQCGGCAEVTVAGETPGTFIIDNACFGMIAANEGTDFVRPPSRARGRAHALPRLAGGVRRDGRSLLSVPRLSKKPCSNI